MRQFILGKNVAYTSQTTLDKVEDGAVAFFYNKAGQLTVNKDGKGLEKELMLVLGRPTAKGGSVVLPVFKNNFSFVKTTYQAGTKFAASMTTPNPTKKGVYSVIVVLKGKKFNERNKFTASVYVNHTTMSNTELATALKDKINAFKHITGLTASTSAATLNFAGDVEGVDFNVICADELTGTKVTISKAGIPAIGDAKYIVDLANKAAADAGIEYTYRDDVDDLYPHYPINPLEVANAADKGFTIYTLRFAEPRDVKTRDEVVNQIIQVAFPTGAAQMTEFEAVCKVLAGDAPAV